MQPKRLKILFVRPTLGQGGADRVTIQLLKHFDRTRFVVELALMRSEGEFLVDLPTDVPMHSLGAKRLWGMVVPLLNLIKKNKYDVIYSTCSGTNLIVLICKMVFRASGIFVCSERSSLYRNDHKKQTLLRIMKRLTYRAADWVTAVSTAIGRQLVNDFGVASDKVIVVNNPLVDTALQLGKEESIDIPEMDRSLPIVLTAGRLVPVKNFELLLKAVAVLYHEIPINLVLLGSGPLRNQLNQMSEQLQISRNVFFLGFDKNPYKYMSKCDVFVLSSNFEGMPGVLIQALACGAAVVSTDCPTGPNEIIVDGKNGFLVPVNDANAMADRIRRLLRDSNLRNEFKLNAPNSVKRFETSVAVDSYFSFLQ